MTTWTEQPDFRSLQRWLFVYVALLGSLSKYDRVWRSLHTATGRQRFRASGTLQLHWRQRRPRWSAAVNNGTAMPMAAVLGACGIFRIRVVPLSGFEGNLQRLCEREPKRATTASYGHYFRLWYVNKLNEE